jgi:predicted TIM-barrel fold metal-dependent hydrolase
VIVAAPGKFCLVVEETRSPVGRIIDCNVHLWDQRDNPVFWLSDRTQLRDMLGNYDSLPDTYALRDYQLQTAGYDVSGVIWSDAGAADPLAAADWVSAQQGEAATSIIALVTLGDPTSAEFASLVEQSRQKPLIRSVRIRLVPELSGSADGGDLLDNRQVRENLRLLARSGLVATVEAASSQLGTVTRLAAHFPDLKIVIDHFGWPAPGPDAEGMTDHTRHLASLATAANVATRIDAIGTIFGDWTLAQIRPWLLEVTSTFGPERCMLGSDLPIENLRSGFGSLYAAYDAIFSGASDDERAMLFHRSAERWYAHRDR